MYSLYLKVYYMKVCYSILLSLTAAYAATAPNPDDNTSGTRFGNITVGDTSVNNSRTYVAGNSYTNNVPGDQYNVNNVPVQPSWAHPFPSEKPTAPTPSDNFQGAPRPFSDLGNAFKGFATRVAQHVTTAFAQAEKEAKRAEEEAKRAEAKAKRDAAKPLHIGKTAVDARCLTVFGSYTENNVGGQIFNNGQEVPPPRRYYHKIGQPHPPRPAHAIFRTSPEEAAPAPSSNTNSGPTRTVHGNQVTNYSAGHQTINTRKYPDGSKETTIIANGVKTIITKDPYGNVSTSTTPFR